MRFVETAAGRGWLAPLAADGIIRHKRVLGFALPIVVWAWTVAPGDRRTGRTEVDSRTGFCEPLVLQPLDVAALPLAWEFTFHS